MAKSPLLKETPPPQDPDPKGVGDGNGAGEEKRFEQTPPPDDTGIPEGLPEKFLRDGKPDFTALTKSYVELEKKKREDILAELEAERKGKAPEAPDKYEIPQIEGTNAEEMAKHPLFDWFRKEAHDRGFSQEEFAGFVGRYVEANRPAEIDIDAERAALGDNADARIRAAQTFADGFKDDWEHETLVGLTSSARGVKLLERLMGTGNAQLVSDPPPAKPEVTLEELKKMQADPRYWNPSARDPEWVRKVEEGYAKLYGAKK